MEKFKPITNQSSNWLANSLNSLKTFANISKFAGFGGWKRDKKEETGRNYGKYVCTLSKLPRAFYPASKLLSWTFCSLSKSFCRWDPANHIAWESQIVKAHKFSNIEGKLFSSQSWICKNTYFRKLRKSRGKSRGSSERPGWALCLEFHQFPPEDKLSTRTDQYVDLFKLQKLVGGVAEILDGLKSLDKAVKTLEDELFLEVPWLAHFPLLFVLLLLLVLVLVLVLLSFVLVIILFEVWGTLGFVLLEKTLKWGREFWPKSTWNWFLNSLSVFSEAFTLSKASSTCFSFILLPAGHNQQGHKHLLWVAVVSCLY